MDRNSIVTFPLGKGKAGVPPLVEEVKEIEFYGDRLLAFVRDGKVYIPMLPICRSLGLSHTDSVRSYFGNKAVVLGAILPSGPGLKHFVKYLCLLPEQLQEYLTEALPGRISRRYRDKLKLYQQECISFILSRFQRESDQTACITQASCDSDKEIVPIGQQKEVSQEHIKEINFYGDRLAVVEQDGSYYVACKPICEAIGVDWSSQRKLLLRNPVLKSTVVIMTRVATDGKAREMVCLPLEYLNGWLFKIDVHRVKDETARQKLIRYQKECYHALFKHFFSKHGADKKLSVIRNKINLLEKKMSVLSQKMTLLIELTDRIDERIGVYTNRLPDARERRKMVVELWQAGLKEEEIARRTGMSVTSVFRILSPFKVRLKAELMAKAAELYCQGHTISEIARKLGIPRSTVNHWLHGGDNDLEEENFFGEDTKEVLQ